MLENKDDDIQLDGVETLLIMIKTRYRLDPALP